MTVGASVAVTAKAHAIFRWITRLEAWNSPTPFRTVNYLNSHYVRYPEDPYDRIWTSNIDTTNDVPSDIIRVDTSTAPANPPLYIFRKALTSKTDSLVLTTLSPSNGPYFIITYYSEVSDSSSTRSFELFETSTSGSNSLASHPFSPTYGSVDQQYMYNYTVDSITTISLNASIDSDLPQS
ncbi:malectin-like carbohydrate-binding domain-containing protein [Tanacetum coccineum]